MPRFFAVTASTAKSSSAARRDAPPEHLAVLRDDRSRWLRTPCALRLGGPNPTSQPLTPSVAPRVLSRDLRCSRVRCPSPVCRQAARRSHVARTPIDIPVLEVCRPEPRAPSFGSISTSRSSEAARVPCYVRARPPRTGSPDALELASSKDEPPRRATPRSSRFASRLPSTTWRRCFSPTSATDSRHVHP